MSAWIYQDDKQVKKVGEEKASWYVGWLSPEGKRRCKSCGPGKAGLRNAEKFKERKEAELLVGTYQEAARKTWKDLRREWDEKIGSGLGPRSRQESLDAMDHFEDLIKPVKVASIKTATMDDFIARRRQQRGKKPGSTVSPATVNKDLRHLKAVLNVAVEWEWLERPPVFRMLREMEREPNYVNPDDFAAIYKACDVATMPRDLQGVEPAAWWRALLVFAYMTGWRSGQILAVERADLDLEAGRIVSRCEDNKGKRDRGVKLRQTVIDHLKAIPSLDPRVFPWDHDRRTLDVEFDRIQAAAGIRLHCPRKHNHTEACHYYGFHDLRRAFATLNADRMQEDELQALMQHKSFLTTKKYINLGRRIDDAGDKVFVPDFLDKPAPKRRKRAGG